MKLSVVVALYNEQDNIEPLCRRMKEALEGLDYELILVNDGSTDDTGARVLRYGGPRVKYVEFAKNFGQSPAMQAGIDIAKGEYIVTMDGDLQNDPLDIPMMLQLAEREDWDVVAGRRKNRQDHKSRTLPSRIANWMIRSLTDVQLKDYGCSLRVYKAKIAKSLDLFGELHRFIPVLASNQGARMTEVDVMHHARLHGESKYDFRRTYKVLADLIFMLFFQRYLQRPMHIFGGAGLLSSGIGVVILIVMLFQKVFFGVLMGPRPLLSLGVLLVIIGFQFVTLGVVAELLMRIYFSSSSKRPYIIKSIVDCGAI